MMSSGIYRELTDAVVSMIPRIREAMPAVHAFINDCDFLSDTCKAFYDVMLAECMAFILEPAYDVCVSRQFDKGARNRLESGADYSIADFEAYWKHARLGDGRDAADIRDTIINGRRYV